MALSLCLISAYFAAKKKKKEKVQRLHTNMNIFESPNCAMKCHIWLIDLVYFALFLILL